MPRLPRIRVRAEYLNSRSLGENSQSVLSLLSLIMSLMPLGKASTKINSLNPHAEYESKIILNLKWDSLKMNRFKVALNGLVAQTVADIDAFRLSGDLSTEPDNHFLDIHNLVCGMQKSPETAKIGAECVF